MLKEARLNPEIAYDSIIDSRDGQIYKIVKIGSQVWMAENLNYADSVKTPSLKGKSWCFEKDPEKCAVTGRIYLWAAAIDSMKFATDADNPQDCGYGKICKLSTKEQGICPLGWHLPTKTEWETLFTEVGGLSTVGKMLKSLTGWNFSGNGTDAYGFSALPAGDFDFGDFLCDGNQTFFWSATQGDATSAYSVLLLYEKDRAYFEGYNKRYGHSVRCLKD